MAVYSYEAEKVSVLKMLSPSILEVGTVSYNEDSANYTIWIDYGFISALIISEEDYGNITDIAYFIEDFGNITTETSPVFGTLGKFRSQTVIGFSLLHVGGVQFALQGGAYESFGTPFIGYELLETNSNAKESTIISYIGSGNITGFTGAAEKISFAFNESSVALFNFDNFNLISEIPQEFEDFGHITSNTYYELSNYGYVSVTSQNNPYGLFKFFGDGSKEVRFSLTTNDPIVSIINHKGSGNESISPAPEIGFGKIQLSGSLQESYTPATEVGSGSLFGLITKEERTTYSYNTSSQVIVEDNDYGFISNQSPTILQYSNTPISAIADEVVSTFTVSGTITPDDFGSVSTLVNRSDSEDFGLITGVQKRPFGFLRFEGDNAKTTRFVLRYIGSGSLFTFTGSGESTASNPPETTILFRTTGSVQESYTPATEVGSGSLFNFITKEERRTYSYNSSSQVIVEDDDYGFVSELHQISDDFGSVSTLVNRSDSEDFGLITGVQKRPFGFLRFEGDNAKTTRFVLRYIGSGSLFAFTGSAESTTSEPPVSGLFRVSGSLVERNTESYFGSGSLFNFITKEERRTYSYNGSSAIGGTKNIIDYRFVNEVNISSEDYGSVTDFSDSGIYDTIPYPEFDYGFITDTIDDTRIPYGRFRFSGSLQESYTPATEIGSGSLFTFTSFTESTIFNPPESTILHRFSGSAIEKLSPSEVGSGSLFNFITKEERRTYSYNGSSQVIVDYDDYGVVISYSPQIIEFASTPISDIANEVVSTFTVGGILNSDDFGSISEIVTRPDSEDFGLITGTQKRPFGFLNLEGKAHTARTRDFVGSGSLFTFISFTESTGSTEPVSGLFKVSGSAIEKLSPSEVGSGSLFNFITKEERRTYSYNGSSATGGTKNIIDHRFINEFYVSSEDYGLVTDFSDSGIYDTIPYPEFDYGFITDTIDDTRIPYGFLNLEGKAHTTRTRDFVGSGSLFAFTGSAEAIGTPETGYSLFTLSGRATESYTPATEVGSGSLFNFITKEERRTYSYNGSSVILREDEDYGFIDVLSSPQIIEFASTPISAIADEVVSTFNTLTYVESEDYGLTSGSLGGDNYEDYGSLTDIQRRPYGTFRISGAASDLKSISSHRGSGSLFAFTGSAESIGVSPDTSIAFKLFSDTRESYTPATEVGSGSLFTFISFTESTGSTEPASGLFRLSGASIEKNTESYVGSGTLFTYTGSASAYSPIGLSSGLFRFSSGSKEKFLGDYVTSGFIPLNSYTSILDPNEKVRIVGAYESVTAKPRIPASGFRVQGQVGRIFFQYGEAGSGRLTIAGDAIVKTNPIHFGFGTININGISPEAVVPAPHIGSGSLFSFVGGAESVTPAPEIGYSLFKFFGSATDIRETNVEVGSGLIGPINTESLILIKFDYPVNCEISVRGSAVEKNTESYVGSGLITPVSTTDVYFTSRYLVTPNPIRIRPTDTEQSASIVEVGSGTLFSFVSSSESFGANPPERTQLFRLSGSSTTSETQSYVGSGIINGKQSVSTGGLIYDLSDAAISEYADEIISDYASIPVCAIRSIITGIEPKQRLVGAHEAFISVPPQKDNAIKIIGSREFESSTPAHYGSGSLFSFNGGEESSTFSPADTRALFRFGGSSEESIANDIVGSGSLFGFNSSTSSVLFDYSASSGIVDPTDPTKIIFKQNILVRVNGSASEVFTPAPYLGFGTISTLNGSSVSKSISNETTVLFEFNGSGEISRTKDYIGTGRIFEFGGSTNAAFYTYEIQQKAFKIFGSTFESFGKSNYIGNCYAIFNGKSEDNKVDYDPPKPVIIYMI